MTHPSCWLPRGRKSLLPLLISSPSSVAKCSWKLLSQGGKFNLKNLGSGPAIPRIRQQGQMGLPLLDADGVFRSPGHQKEGNVTDSARAGAGCPKPGGSSAQQEIKQPEGKEAHGGHKWPCGKQKSVTSIKMRHLRDQRRRILGGRMFTGVWGLLLNLPEIVNQIELSKL